MASYSYLVTITNDGIPPEFGFERYRTSATSSEQTEPLISTKTLTGNPAGTGITSEAVNTTIGNVVPYPAAEAGPVVFTGTINVTGGRMDVFTDSISQTVDPVPGPLPVLGAAAGFGWTRRLRKRIRSSK